MRLKTILSITAFATPLMMVIMSLQGAPLKTTVTPLGILNLEFAGKVDRAADIYNAWNPNLLVVATNNTLIDFLFLISYGCFLFACSRILSRRFYSTWKNVGTWISSLALFAALFDVVENILMFRTLGGNIYKEIVATTFIFAASKFFLVTLALLYIIFSLVALLVKRKQPADNFQLPTH